MKAAGPTLYLASGNLHKVGELQRLADHDGLALAMRSARDLGGMPEVVEDTGTFAGNALKKARALRAIVPTGGWVIADDSGICVDALAGGPGVESAYFAGPTASDEANLEKLIEVMRGVPPPERGAHYVCVLVVLDEAGRHYGFVGNCPGKLALEPAGQGGFGYDPLFVPSGNDQTFGVLPAETKQALSHRAKAWADFAAWFRSRGVSTTDQS